MNHTSLQTQATLDSATLFNADGKSPVLLVCEHASNSIPPRFNNLGLDLAVIQSHVAWDPGAFGVAMNLTKILDARLVASNVSRLVYDCNRPPEAKSAMPVSSEIYQIPGNIGLSTTEKQQRVKDIYEPFQTLLRDSIAASRVAPIIVTIHSFTPIYNGKKRAVELGILHDKDARLADSMFAHSRSVDGLNIQKNAPYDASDGVTHTLQIHAVPFGYLNVMIEIANNLIATPLDQEKMANILADILTPAISDTGADLSAVSGQTQIKDTECQK